MGDQKENSGPGVGEFVASYYQHFREVLSEFDPNPIGDIVKVLIQVRDRGGVLWVAGNGGSSAISDHLVCDATKGTYVDGVPSLRSISLTSNTALLTALGNDIGYEDVFRMQLLYYLRPGDAVLFISSSGNSPNVVEACRYARSRDVTTLAFVGFDGGRLRELADHVVWIPVHNYGMVEDAHQSLMHCVTQYMRRESERSVKNETSNARAYPPPLNHPGSVLQG